MITYVVGFAFDPKFNHVVLIEKQKPEWQKGKLNGIGGKLETRDTSYADCMSREFEEETGVRISCTEWRQYATMRFEGVILICLTTVSDKIYQCKTMEAEKVALIKTADLHLFSEHAMIKNLRVLIPMAMDNTFINSEILFKL